MAIKSEGAISSTLLPVSNEQIVLRAVLRLGGNVEPIDPEDVAMAADQIAPRKFRWKKYPKQIDLELINNGLRDAKKRGWLTGTAPKGWMLTRDGLREGQKLETEAGRPFVRPRACLQLRDSQLVH